MFQFPLHRDPRCNDCQLAPLSIPKNVSVPFTSGSSLQLASWSFLTGSSISFSSLYIGILAATCSLLQGFFTPGVSVPFTSGSSLQRERYYRAENDILNVSVPFTSGSSLQLHLILEVPNDLLFQFPLHRDPRCNLPHFTVDGEPGTWFQFPLHRDPRCNGRRIAPRGRIHEFQFPLHRDPRCNGNEPDKLYTRICFSSLYIGILAATKALNGEV